MNDTTKTVIQVDCDREWENIGVSIDILKKFLEIFEKYKIKATWFTVGEDFECNEYREFFIAIVKKKHEIANHTYSHNKNFHILSNKEKLLEVSKCDEQIRNLGYTPRGFRAPYFNFNDSNEFILESLNYKYDASIFPCPYVSVFNKIKNIINKDSIQIIHQNTSSYHYSKSNIIKYLPISVCPIIHLPIHASYAMVLPERLAYAYISFALKLLRKRNEPIIYVFHLNDLCSVHHLKSREFEYFWPYEKRLAFVEWVCKEIQYQSENILSCNCV